MIRYTFTAQTQDIRRFARGDRQIQKALFMAKKDTMRMLKNEAARQVSSMYYVTQKQVKEAITEYPSGIRVRSGMLSLEKYKITPTRPTKSKKQLLGAVKRGPLKPIGPSFLRLARGVYKPFSRPERGMGRPKLITGPSIAQLVGNQQIMEQLEVKAAKTYEARADFYVSQLAASLHMHIPKGAWRR